MKFRNSSTTERIFVKLVTYWQFSLKFVAISILFKRQALGMKPVSALS
jgi:hypothetical protein